MNLIKKALIGVALVFIGLFTISVVAGFIGAMNEVTKETTTPAKVETKQPVEQKKDDTPVEPTLNKVTAAERAEFMSGCDPDGTMTSYCECALNYLEETLGREGIIDMANNMQEGDLPQPMVDALDACFDKL